MAFGNAIQKRLKEIAKQGQNIPDVICSAMSRATLEAIMTTTERTPPTKEDPIRGTGTISGDLQSHWYTDSEPIPAINGKTYTTLLANNLFYASYVNDGHVLNQHFVPGLIINPYSGLLERFDNQNVGIVVGTQTKWVRGRYMREAGHATYRRVFENYLITKARENFK